VTAVVPRVAPQETQRLTAQRPPKKTLFGRARHRIAGIFGLLRRHPIASTALLLCLAGGGVFVGLAVLEHEEAKRAAHAVYKVLSASKLSAPERAIIAKLPQELRPALRLDPQAPEAWEALMVLLPKETPPKDGFELLLPRGVIAEPTPTFQFRTPNADLPVTLSVRTGDTERAFDLPRVQSNQFPVSFVMPREVPLPPGDYTWEVSVDRRRVERTNPPIVAVPEPAQLSFRLVDAAVLDEVERTARFAHDPMLDAYFQAWLLLERGLAQRAAQVLATIRPKGQPQARMVQRWRYLEAKAHAVLGERSLFLEMFESAYLPAEGRPKPPPKADDEEPKPAKGKRPAGKGKGKAQAPPQRRAPPRKRKQ
jgi:hypothetical protein